MKINIPFEIIKSNDDNDNPYYYGANVEDTGGYYGTDAKAKKRIRATIETKIREALKITENTRTAFVFCHDQTVLFIHFDGQWGYALTRPEQTSTGYNYGVGQTFQTCLERAKKHAEDFGGIISVSY